MYLKRQKSKFWKKKLFFRQFLSHCIEFFLNEAIFALNCHVRYLPSICRIAQSSRVGCDYLMVGFGSGRVGPKIVGFGSVMRICRYSITPQYQLVILNLMHILKRKKKTEWWQKTLKTTLADIFILPQCFFNPLRIFRQNLNKICHLCTTNEEDKFVFIRKSRVNLPIF